MRVLQVSKCSWGWVPPLLVFPSEQCALGLPQDVLRFSTPALESHVVNATFLLRTLCSSVPDSFGVGSGHRGASRCLGSWGASCLCGPDCSRIPPGSSWQGLKSHEDHGVGCSLSTKPPGNHKQGPLNSPITWQHLCFHHPHLPYDPRMLLPSVCRRTVKLKWRLSTSPPLQAVVYVGKRCLNSRVLAAF